MHFKLKLLAALVFFGPAFQIWAAEDEPTSSNWRALVREHNLNGLPGRQDSLVRIILSDTENGKQQVFGPFLVWKSISNGEQIQITNSISSLSDAAKQATAGLTGEDRKLALTNLFSQVLRREQAALFTGEYRQKLLEKISADVSKEASEKLNKLAPDIQQDWQSDGFKISVAVVTGKGAVERITIIGASDPIQVKSYTAEVIGADGTVPKRTKLVGP